MSKINNKLIILSAILAFVFSLSLTGPSPAYASMTSTLNSGNVTFYQNIPYALQNTPPTPIQTRNTNPTNTNSNTNATNNSSSTTTSNNTVSENTDKNSTVADNTNKENYSNLAANALLGSNSFMPTGLVQWIFFIIMIVLIIFLWRYVHHSEEKYKLEPMKHA